MTEKEPMMTLKTKPDGNVRSGVEGDGDAGSHDSSETSSAYARTDDGLPLLGLFAIGFGLLGIFTIAPVFVPLALIFGLVAIFMGQIALGLTALVLSLVGVATSPTLMLILGIGAFATWLGVPLPF